MIKPFSPRTTAFIIAFVVGSGVFAAGCLGHLLILQLGESPWLAMLDDLCVAGFAAALVLYYEWRRDVELRRKLSTVTEMNHHVRNQLEVIEYSAWATHNQAHIAQMHQAVARIEWALREILGKRYERSPSLPPAKPPRPAQHAGAAHLQQSAE